jgi:cephalosporin hydroxylase
LAAYAPLVTPGCYLIVEDTDFFDTGMAVEHWKPAHPEFAADPDREKFRITHNPGSYLLRKADG